MDQTPSTGMPVATPAKSKKGLLIGAAVILALIIGGYVIMKDNGGEPKSVTDKGNSLSIADQEVAMLAIFVDSVSVKVPAYIVVHEDANGAAGAVIATSQMLAPGSYEKISFVAKLTEGKTYWAMLHADNGNGTYEAQNDSEHLMDNDGKEVLVKFMAKSEAVFSGDKG